MVQVSHDVVYLDAAAFDAAGPSSSVIVLFEAARVL
jgi:hypothetical protein